MPFPVYIGWGLLIPIGLSLLSGLLTHRAIGIWGYQRKNTVWERTRTILPSLILFTLWGMVNIPLPVVYVLIFIGKFLLILHKDTNRADGIFIINITHLMTMALHMILIGGLSLAVEMPMNEFLQQPFWRIATIDIVLALNNLGIWLISRWGMLFSVFRTQSKSEEIRTFRVFLWFCNFFLLMDSVLCIAKIDWNLLPVFLIGSTVLMEFYLIRFHLHLYQLLKMRHVEVEHQSLMEELELRNRTTEDLRNKSNLDVLTGVFSRRYVMEQAAFLLRSKEPFSLVFIDLDHLKKINDKEGHHAGDRYLIRFAREFASQLRRFDIFARIGGDEFTVLLPGCTQEDAIKRLDHIRMLMEEEYSPPLFFSYGVFFVRKDSAESVEQIFHRADQAMYQDKQTRTGL